MFKNFRGHSTFVRFWKRFRRANRYVETTGHFRTFPRGRSGEMPADFSALTTEQQQALMDASMSGLLMKGRWIGLFDSWNTPFFKVFHVTKTGPPIGIE